MIYVVIGLLIIIVWELSDIYGLVKDIRDKNNLRL